MYVISIILYRKIESLYGDNFIYAITLRQSFIAYSSFFFAGMLSKIHFKHIARYSRFIPLFIVSLLLFLDFYTISIIGNDLHRALYPIYLAILMIGFALFIPALKHSFADISYGIYIYHYPIFSVLFGLGISKICGNAMQVVVIFSTCVIVSLISYYLVEIKCIRYGKK